MIACVDVGGTSVKRGLVSGATVEEVDSVAIDAAAPTDVLLEQLTSAFAGLVEMSNVQVAGLAVAFPAPFDYEAGIPLIVEQKKFSAIYGQDLRRAIAMSDIGPELPVRFLNDAAAAALGEARCGAAVGASRVLMLTLGTGFGAAAVVDGFCSQTVEGLNIGELYRREIPGWGSADEILSATGLAASLGVALSELPQTADAARAAGTSSEFASFGVRLGEFVAPIAEQLGLSAIIVGGGCAPAFDLFGPSAASRVGCALLPAQLGPQAALIGAATCFP